MSEFKKLTEREHLLERPNMYIGAIQESESERFIDGNLKNIKTVPGLIKITNELIDNSVDEFLRSEQKFAKNIIVNIDSDGVIVSDDGRGIPVENYNGELRPQVAWCEARAGTSFSNDRVGPGANGVGSFAANVFSSSFTGETSDGKLYCKVACTDNMTTIKTTTKKTNSHGTRVVMVPDFNRFGCKGYSEDHILSIRERIISIAATYNKISIKFNGEKIKFRNETEFLKRFGDEFVNYSLNNAYFGVFSSTTDEYCQYTSIDGLEMPFGGTHESYLMREISNELKTLIKRKYKLDMSCVEIKRCLQLVFIGRYFPNMEFESQTKEKLSNTESCVKKWLGNIDFNKIAKKIMNSPNIIDPIIEAKLAKQLAADKRAVTMAQKKMEKIRVDKYFGATSKNVNERILYITEGDSACGSLRNLRDVKTQGGYPLKGIPMNTFSASEKDIVSNKELKGLMTIIGLRFDDILYEINKDNNIIYAKERDYINYNGTWKKIEHTNLKYKKVNPIDENMKKYVDCIKNEEVICQYNYNDICILADADLDGQGGVVPLLLLFLYHWPELFASNKIHIVQSPKYELYRKKNGKNEYKLFYDADEYKNNITAYKDYEATYIKGLGSLNPYSYKETINNKNNWLTVDIDEAEWFKIMYSENADARKVLMNS